jgi:hypothetical protein
MHGSTIGSFCFVFEVSSLAVFQIRIQILRPPGSGSVIICTDPDSFINKQKNVEIFFSSGHLESQ